MVELGVAGNGAKRMGEIPFIWTIFSRRPCKGFFFSLPASPWGLESSGWGKGGACSHQLIFRQRQEAFFCVCVCVHLEGGFRAGIKPLSFTICRRTDMAFPAIPILRMWQCILRFNVIPALI